MFRKVLDVLVKIIGWIRNRLIGVKDFLLRIGDDLLVFLRNLTPAILFLSMSILTFSKLNSQRVDWGNWALTLFAFSTLFIAFLALTVNVIQFFKKTMGALMELEKRERSEKLNCKESLKFLWVNGAAKEAFFYYVIVVTAIISALVSGMFAAWNMYKVM